MKPQKQKGFGFLDAPKPQITINRVSDAPPAPKAKIVIGMDQIYLAKLQATIATHVKAFMDDREELLAAFRAISWVPEHGSPVSELHQAILHLHNMDAVVYRNIVARDGIVRKEK